MKDIKTEIWKPINGYEGLYEVSNLGNVRSLDRYIETEKGKCFRKGRMRKSFISNAGYKIVSLCSKKYLVHDEENRFSVGDKVTIVEDRPISKRKSWQVVYK